MKISFDFTGHDNAALDRIFWLLFYIVKQYTSGEFIGLKAEKGTLYVNLFDENGVEQTLTTGDGKTVDFVVRGEPYKRKYKNMSNAIDLSDREQSFSAYMYEKYT